MNKTEQAIINTRRALANIPTSVDGLDCYRRLAVANRLQDILRGLAEAYREASRQSIEAIVECRLHKAKSLHHQQAEIIKLQNECHRRWMLMLS